MASSYTDYAILTHQHASYRFRIQIFIKFLLGVSDKTQRWRDFPFCLHCVFVLHRMYKKAPLTLPLRVLRLVAPVGCGHISVGCGAQITGRGLITERRFQMTILLEKSLSQTVRANTTRAFRRFLAYVRGTQIFKNSRSHLIVLGATRVIQNKFHTENPQILGATVQKLVSLATWLRRFVHQWPI
jgi:hypothetical protein